MRHDDRLRLFRSGRARGAALAACVAACASGPAGCQSSESREFTLWNPFGFRNPFQPDQPPLRIGMVADTQGVFDPRTWVETFKTPPWEELSKHLSSELKRPVQVEPLTADQIAFHLQSGRIQFALVSGADVDRILGKTQAFLEIARAEAATRKGVIVADADSGIRSMSELKGKRFAFGPSGDPILDTAAKEALRKAGVTIDDLKREILPIPGTLQYHLSSFEVAKEIVYGGTPAGVMDQDEFESLPERGGKFTWKGFTLSRDQFTVLGATDGVPLDTIEDARFLASKTADAALVERLRHVLLEMDRRRREACLSLGFRRFTPPSGSAPSGSSASSSASA